MPTRSIRLTRHLDDPIKETVATGRFQDASDVVCEGLRLLEQRLLEDAARLARLRSEAKRGFDAIADGRYRDVSPDTIDSHVARLGNRTARRLRRRQSAA